MSGQQNKMSGENKGQQRQHLHNPTGITDEVANEEHEFMQQAEQSADQGTNTAQSAGQNIKQKGGLESSSDMGSKTGDQGGSTMENVKNKAKDAMNMK